MTTRTPTPSPVPRSRRLVETVAGVPIASVGLALALFLYEFPRMSAFRSIAASTLPSALAGLVILITLVVFAVVYAKRPTFRLHRHTAACLSIAGAFSLSVLAILGASILPDTGAWERIATLVMYISETALLLCWGETLLLLTARNVAAVYAWAVIILGVLNALSCIFKVGTAGFAVAMLPILSMVCLYWFKDHELAMNDGVGNSAPGVPAAYYVDRTLIPQRYRSDFGIAFLIFMLPLLCLPPIFGYIHHAWIPAQDGSYVSTLIQLSTAVGTVLGGVVLLAFVRTLWGRRKLALYNFFTLLVVTLAFALVGLLPESMPFPYVVLLNIAQKVAFFFVWMAPFLIPCSASPITVWCAALGLYQCGKTISNTVVGLRLPLSSYAIVVVFFVLALIVGFAAGLILDQGKREYDPLSAPDADADGDGGDPGTRTDAVAKGAEREVDPGIADAPLPPAPMPDIFGDFGGEPQPEGGTGEEVARACSLLAKRYQLSRREEDVLGLLARGMVAREVAEALVISNSTAKTHMRNLYAKMGVHSQTELVLLISQAK